MIATTTPPGHQYFFSPHNSETSRKKLKWKQRTLGLSCFVYCHKPWGSHLGIHNYIASELKKSHKEHTEAVFNNVQLDISNLAHLPDGIFLPPQWLVCWPQPSAVLPQFLQLCLALFWFQHPAAPSSETLEHNQGAMHGGKCTCHH